MKLYKSPTNEVYAYESDGSQDDIIPSNYVQISEQEADILRAENQQKAYDNLPNDEKISICKQKAIKLLQETDWATIADVVNPAMSNPYLENQAEFIAYRNDVRQYAVYPVEGNIDWPTAPTENWVKV